MSLERILADFVREHCPAETNDGACAYCGGQRCYDAPPSHVAGCRYGEALVAADTLVAAEAMVGTDIDPRPASVPQNARLAIMWAHWFAPGTGNPNERWNAWLWMDEGVPRVVIERHRR